MPTAKVRIGNDVRLVWALYSADQPLSFDNCSEIEVELYCSRKQLTIKPDYTIADNWNLGCPAALQAAQHGRPRHSAYIHS